MPSLLHHLDNESALMMFLAGELPAEDHAVVERRLAADPDLRAQLDELRSAYRAVEDAIAAGDATQRVALPEASAARRVGQAVRSWQARRLAQPRERELGGRLNLPRWVYVTASCAAAVIVALGIWGIRAENKTLLFPPPKGGINVAITDPEGPSSLPVRPEIAVEEDAYPPVHDDKETAVLADAEDELYGLSQRSLGDLPGILLIGETDEQ
jgi:hypothetical protein